VAWDLNGEAVGLDDIVAQSRYCYRALGHIVKAVGADPSGVVKVVTFLQRPKDFDKVEEIRAEYLPPSQWAASSVLATMVGVEFLLEPELIVATSAKKIITAPEVFASGGSPHAIKVGNTIYTSGIAGFDKSGRLVGAGAVDTQTEQVFRNVSAVLKAAGASWSDLIKMNTYVARREDYSKVVAIRDQYLPKRSTIPTDVIARLVDPNILVQVDCVAVTS
jgi:enamine deaminase RidA (YjgF/YER057c/UK114 family)